MPISMTESCSTGAEETPLELTSDSTPESEETPTKSVHMFIGSGLSPEKQRTLDVVDQCFKKHFVDLAKNADAGCFSSEEITQFRTAFNPTILTQNRACLNTLLSDYNRSLASCDKTAIQRLAEEVRQKKAAKLRHRLKQQETADGRQNLLGQEDDSFETLTQEDLLSENPVLADLVNQIKRALYVSYMQFYLNHIESRAYAQIELMQQIVKYQSLLAALNISEGKMIEGVLADIAAANQKEKGLLTRLEEQRKLVAQGKTQAIKKFLSRVGDVRSDIVWTSHFLRTILKCFPDDAYNKTVTQDILNLPGQIPSYLSTIIRYTRLSLNLLLLLKHIIAHPWMRSDEKSIKAKERLLAQLRQRRVNLISDLLWMVGHICCALWLDENLGNGLTALLICFEVGNAVTEWWTARVAHKAIMKTIEESNDGLQKSKEAVEENLVVLRAAIATERRKEAELSQALNAEAIGSQLSVVEREREQSRKACAAEITRLLKEIEQEKLKLAHLNKELQALSTLKITRDRAWYYQSRRYFQGAFSVGLGFLACVSMALSVLPPFFLLTPVGWGFLGAVLSFGLTAFSNVVSLAIDRLELTASQKQLREEFDEYVKGQQFLTVGTLHLLKGLFITGLEQHAERRSKAEQQFRTAAIYVLVPTAVLASAMFLPFALSLAITVLSLILGKGSDYIVQNRYTAQKEQIKLTKERIEENLNDEKKLPNQWQHAPHRVYGFFSSINVERKLLPLKLPKLQNVSLVNVLNRL